MYVATFYLHSLLFVIMLALLHKVMLRVQFDRMNCEDGVLYHT
jgi:hypothetical protein